MNPLVALIDGAERERRATAVVNSMVDGGWWESGFVAGSVIDGWRRDDGWYHAVP